MRDESGEITHFVYVFTDATARTELEKQTAETAIDVEELRETLTVIIQAALTGGETVKQLLQFARAPADEPSEPVDLTTLAREVVQLTAPHWHFRLELAATAPIASVPKARATVVAPLEARTPREGRELRRGSAGVLVAAA